MPTTTNTAEKSLELLVSLFEHITWVSFIISLQQANMDVLSIIPNAGGQKLDVSQRVNNKLGYRIVYEGFHCKISWLY